MIRACLLLSILAWLSLCACTCMASPVTLYPYDDNPLRPVVSLSGMWRFRADYANAGLVQKWFSVPLPYNSSTIAMPVPASWNDVTNDPKLMDHHGVVWYERTLAVSAGLLATGRVMLRVGSANYHTRVWLDSAEVLELAHEGGHLPFEADITALLTRGAAAYRLSIRVDATLDRTTLPPVNGYGSQVDFFNYGGIDRPVVVYATPATFISDVTVATDSITLGDATFFNMEPRRHTAHVPSASASSRRVHRRSSSSSSSSSSSPSSSSSTTTSAQLHYSVSVSGLAAADAVISVQLLAPDGQTIVANSSGSSGVWTIQDAQLWQPCGMPTTHNCSVKAALYTCVVRLLADDSEGAAVLDEVVVPHVGIRTVQVAHTQFLINGAPFYFHGINKHEDNDVRGKGLDLPLLAKDWGLLQWLHVNSFRTSHYPYADEWYQLADQFGVAVIDELPAVGMEANDFSADTLAHHQAFASAMYARDKNHPSVVLWSLFNEPVTSGAGVADYFKNMSAFMRNEQALAPRPVTFVNYQGPGAVFNDYDVLTINKYNGWYSQFADLTAGMAALRNELAQWRAMFPDKPLMLTEFGCDTVTGLHADPATPYSEEFQLAFYNAYYEVLDEEASREFVVGELPWNFADFATGYDMRRITNLNRKGIFTRQRQPKAAAFLIRDRYTQMEQAGRAAKSANPLPDSNANPTPAAHRAHSWTRDVRATRPSAEL